MRKPTYSSAAPIDPVIKAELCTLKWNFRLAFIEKKINGLPRAK